MEKDDELKGEGNSYDFGARMLDPRIGRWFSTDNITKPELSPYLFSANSPTNFADPDGNDEIHFYYLVTQSWNEDGEIVNVLTLSAEIIENDKAHTYHIHDIKDFSHPEGTQFYPFGGGGNMIADSGAPLSNGISWGFGFFNYDITDKEYLGRLLELAPEVMEHYKDDGSNTYFHMNYAKNRASSVSLTENLITAEETVFAIVDGYYVVKGLSSFALKQYAKASIEIARPSVIAISAQAQKVVKHKNSLDAVGHFVLYEIYDRKTKEILKVGLANADDVMADGVTIQRAHTSARLARKEGYKNAAFRVVEDLGVTTKGVAKQKEASRVVTKRKAGKDLPLNREKDKAYQPNN